jgi:hypothetical protein
VVEERKRWLRRVEVVEDRKEWLRRVEVVEDRKKWLRRGRSGKGWRQEC